METVSRLLAEFKRSGWPMEDGRCFQADPAALGRIAIIGRRAVCLHAPAPRRRARQPAPAKAASAFDDMDDAIPF